LVEFFQLMSPGYERLDFRCHDDSISRDKGVVKLCAAGQTEVAGIE
jgi:hypothetical protein